MCKFKPEIIPFLLWHNYLSSLCLLTHLKIPLNKNGLFLLQASLAEKYVTFWKLNSGQAKALKNVASMLDSCESDNSPIILIHGKDEDLKTNSF